MLTCVIAIVALVLGALFGDRGILHLVEKRRRASTMEQDIARLESENRRLLEEIQGLRTDPRAVEAIAREAVFLIQEERAR